MQAEDKELFANFLRSLPRKDNYYLLVDVDKDQTIQRWMDKVESGETLGVVALQGERMVGYCNLRTNDLPWIRHVGEIRMSVLPSHRDLGIGVFSRARSSQSQGRVGCKSSGFEWLSARRRLKLCSKTWASVPRRSSPALSRTRMV